MKEITKTITKEYDSEGKIIKHTEITVEIETVKENNNIQYVPFYPSVPSINPWTTVYT